MESVSFPKIDGIRFTKIISIIDSIDSSVGSINARIFFKTFLNSTLKEDDVYKNLEFYFAEYLLSILYYI